MAATGGSVPTKLPSSAPPMVHTIRGIIITVTSVALVVCCTRLYIRRFVTRSFGLDDYLVILALIMVVLFAILSLAVTFYGIGYHMDTVPPAKLATMQYIVYISLCAYLWVALAVKSSLTVFIMRIFPTKAIRLIGIGTIIFMVLMTISGELPLILQCRPVKAAYAPPANGDYKCFTAKTLMNIQLYQAILMFLVDVVIIVMPMPTIWKLQMPVQRRLVIMGLFALGFVACAAGLARIPLLGYQENTKDFTSAGAIPLILMNTEYALGLITGSLPSLRILFKFIPGLNSSRKTSKYSRSRSREWTGGQGNAGGYQLSSQSRWSKKVLPKRGADGDSVASESEQRIFTTSKS
ncbi:hypothetical protein ASPVEDRAFT_80288 [Aspergillus versicolor CBS 583.65]|uniref:Rhodopsin domain-containing protein n=1 Tax=Aspergillus versicolor CBS 583.65 TaxID=1036611 RepID=A0A1L9PAZ9_ASPVE|nr:uncharacterized protein ASPVEDRAFT_80288 [Aspergillus versicolor CBS 583.65]OJI98652.1 hypothetical protein ASPVEDRAFT_80288 [Aspergillus versicolor CBS 583.65]